MTELKNFVGGKFADTRDGRTSDVIDPSTGEAYAQAPISSAEDVDAALQAAAEAFGSWRDATPADRSLALLKIADAVEARADELVAAECRNTGKPVALTMSEELPPIVDQLRFFAGAARVLEGRSAGEYMPDHTSYVRREPIGVCAQVTPWNYPLMMAIWKIAPALAAGNAVVLKPSDTTPVSTLLLAEIAVGVPAAGGPQRHLRRPGHRPGPGRPRHPADGVDHRVGPRGPGGGRRGRRRPQAGAPGTGRQGPRHRVR